MLVLSRGEAETIVIGDDIEITICRIAGKSVKIGLRVPSDIQILRGELAAESREHSGPLAELVASRHLVGSSGR